MRSMNPVHILSNLAFQPQFLLLENEHVSIGPIDLLYNVPCNEVLYKQKHGKLT